jgi:hypothetical protein
MSAGTWEEGWTAKELVELSHLEWTAEATGATHVLRAWVKTEMRAWKREMEMAATIAAQTKAIAKQNLEIVGLNEKVRELSSSIVGHKRRADALTGVLTCTMHALWDCPKSPTYTFADGVSGFVSSEMEENGDHWVGFTLAEGPPCSMHFKCSILDKNDDVLRVVSHSSCYDAHEPPIDIAPGRTEDGAGKGARFKLTQADSDAAERPGGHIKLRVGVHLYLPE